MKHSKRLARQRRPRWELHLYVANTSPRSLLALGNLRRICQQHLKTNYRITIVDILRQPAMARVHNILATPTLVHVRRPKDTTVIGTLADTRKVLQALGVSPDSDELGSTLASGFAPIGHA